MKKIICLYGGPGSGKSTTAALLFGNLKNLGFNCELNREYIKEWCWEDRKIQPGDQTYFFAKMSRKERTYILNNLDFIITDSPLILTHFYGLKYDEMEQKYNTSKVLLKHHHGFCKDKGYTVEHYFINRIKEYNPKGRYQTKEQAIQYDTEIKELLNSFNIKYKVINSFEDIINDLRPLFSEERGCL